MEILKSFLLAILILVGIGLLFCGGIGILSFFYLLFGIIGVMSLIAMIVLFWVTVLVYDVRNNSI
jgi:hypothetical protein